MKKFVISAGTAFALSLLMSANSHADIVTVFEANFDGLTATSVAPTQANRDVTAAILNSDASNIGTFSQTSGANNFGHIIGDGGGDNALVFDTFNVGGVQDDDEAFAGTFTQAVDLSAGDTLSFSFDVFATREGAAGSNREIRVELQDAAGNAAYELVLSQDSNKNYDYIDINGVEVNGPADPIGGGDFTNPAVDSFVPGTTNGISLAIAGVSDAAGATADLTVDFGTATPDATVAIGARNAGVTEITQFEISFDGGSVRGAYFDNFVAIADIATVPEPSSLALLGIFSLGFMARRRR